MSNRVFSIKRAVFALPVLCLVALAGCTYQQYCAKYEECSDEKLGEEIKDQVKKNKRKERNQILDDFDVFLNN